MSDIAQVVSVKDIVFVYFFLLVSINKITHIVWPAVDPIHTPKKKWKTTPYQNREITQYQNIGDNSIPKKWEITQYHKMEDNSIPKMGDNSIPKNGI